MAQLPGIPKGYHPQICEAPVHLELVLSEATYNPDGKHGPYLALNTYQRRPTWNDGAKEYKGSPTFFKFNFYGPDCELGNALLANEVFKPLQLIYVVGYPTFMRVQDDLDPTKWKSLTSAISIGSATIDKERYVAEGIWDPSWDDFYAVRSRGNGTGAQAPTRPSAPRPPAVGDW